MTVRVVAFWQRNYSALKQTPTITKMHAYLMSVEAREKPSEDAQRP